mmetsp:Transcript_9688/g.14002  ORF Transcript_9688/g.14002 Transcript_9688/m.14002 type:complete len:881 (+) Transcript_9688:216-2858(+)|eukprot:CAMPEP_0172426364 /NCGR_PEP_ID=MMETSP1064-20121228/37028_1 /TAXON_ID=202472 /ORGANISM="Aulacoseira subarctica , Strain CCAP 1002/5" /LENGTH=880 /DNA_ID=CAMNT_0013169907 /DNA_START=178 /DNA_END=2820 /DNA_ORIENTATION=-
MNQNRPHHPSRLGRMTFLLAVTTSVVKALRLSRVVRSTSSCSSSWTSATNPRFESSKTERAIHLSGLLPRGSRQFSSKTDTERPLSTLASTPAADSDDDVNSMLENILDDVLKVDTAFAAVDNDETEEAFDNILSDVMNEAKRGAEARHSIPDILIEEEPDFTNAKFLSVTNPYWVNNGLDPLVVDVLSGKGISSFTPVQAEAFGPVLAGRDVIGRSRTGTGKTLAFGVPSVLRIQKMLQESGGLKKRGRLPSMIVLCPTRELARQVQEEIELIAKPLGLFSSVFHGGVSYDPQARDLRNGVDIVVGTPGRIIDHIERQNLILSECNIAVLDEADEMLNMGFAEDVERILDGIGSSNAEKAQCLLFSATTPPWVKGIGRQYQKDVLSIDVTATEGTGARTATTVRHLAVQVPPGDGKKAILEDIIAVNICKDDEEEKDDDGFLNPIAEAAREKKRKGTGWSQKIFGKTIVFTQTKNEADEIVSGGVFKSLTAAALHGDVGQKQRDATLNAFRAGSFNVLVATDVAARGIDVQDVDLVIQLSPPRDPDAYVHRSGRTGRAGKKGVSICLFTPGQARDIINIERSLGHGFKFELTGPPSTEAALHAVAKTSAFASKSVPDTTAAYFKGAAETLLAEEGADAADVVAKCLAAISRRSIDVVSRSLLTGEAGYATVEMTNEKGRRVSPGDVMFTVSKLSQMSRRSEDTGISFDPDVGKIQNNAESNKAFFDMSAEDAKKLIEFSKGIEAGGARFSILRELNVERGASFGESRGNFSPRGPPRTNSRYGVAGPDTGRKVYNGGHFRPGENRHSGTQEYGRGGRTGERRDAPGNRGYENRGSGGYSDSRGGGGGYADSRGSGGGYESRRGKESRGQGRKSRDEQGW